MKALMSLHLPLAITIPRKTKEGKRVIMNMNTYRNLHHMTNNQAKIIFKDAVRDMVGQFSLSLRVPGNPPPYKFTYTLFQGQNRKTDVANVLSIVDKFTCDALVELGIIPDDNCRVINEVVYKYGGVDKNYPRAELEITSI
jgi:hypothetical protein